jgi:hypothetical protein
LGKEMLRQPACFWILFGDHPLKMEESRSPGVAPKSPKTDVKLIFSNPHLVEDLCEHYDLIRALGQKLV